MRKIEAEKAAKASHVLLRYMQARHRFKNNVDPQLPPHGHLADRRRQRRV
jgi:hypothetical protein